MIEIRHRMRDTVGIVVDAFTQKFGDRAVSVAEAQLASAVGPAKTSWQKIVDELIKIKKP